MLRPVSWRADDAGAAVGRADSLGVSLVRAYKVFPLPAFCGGITLTAIPAAPAVVPPRNKGGRPKGPARPPGFAVVGNRVYGQGGSRRVIPRETVFQLVDRIRFGLETEIKHRDYCPLYELAKIGMDVNTDLSTRVTCHSTVAKYFYSQRQAIALSNDPENPIDFKIVAIGKLQVALGIKPSAPPVIDVAVEPATIEQAPVAVEVINAVQQP